MPGSLFPSTYAAYAFVVAFLVWMISELVGGTVLPMLRRHGARVERARRSRSSSAWLFVAWVAVIGIPAGLAGSGVILLPDWFSYVGAVLMLAGVALRQWATVVLGRYFSDMIGVQEGQ
jgi:protein-S-isoprenylcysteine O-methyltransferase Ste14